MYVGPSCVTCERPRYPCSPTDAGAFALGEHATEVTAVAAPGADFYLAGISDPRPPRICSDRGASVLTASADTSAPISIWLKNNERKPEGGGALCALPLGSPTGYAERSPRLANHQRGQQRSLSITIPMQLEQSAKFRPHSSRQCRTLLAGPDLPESPAQSLPVGPRERLPLNQSTGAPSAIAPSASISPTAVTSRSIFATVISTP